MNAPRRPGPLVEVCVGDVPSALAAQAGGADRVELCADLGQGGTTPSIGAVEVALRRLTRVGVRVMIRPRGGDFCYGREEVDAVLADVAAIRALPNPAGLEVGFVFGALTAGGELDEPLLERVLAACGPHPLTLHKAVDEVPDLVAAVDVAARLGVDRILSSGGAPDAAAGAGVLRAMVERAGARVTVLAGGGVRPPTVAALIAATGVREVHLRAPMMCHRTETTSVQLVADTVRAARAGSNSGARQCQDRDMTRGTLRTGSGRDDRRRR